MSKAPTNSWPTGLCVSARGVVQLALLGFMPALLSPGDSSRVAAAHALRLLTRCGGSFVRSLAETSLAETSLAESSCCLLPQTVCSPHRSATAAPPAGQANATAPDPPLGGRVPPHCRSSTHPRLCTFHLPAGLF